MHLYHKGICYDKKENYKIVMFVMVKLMEMETTEQNTVALYLFNNIIKIANKPTNFA